METVELVRSLLVKIDTTKDEHKERVLKAIGKSSMEKTNLSFRVKSLKQQGFNFFVNKKFEEKFKYKAGIDGSYRCNKINKANSIGWGIALFSPIVAALITSIVTQDWWFMLIALVSSIVVLVMGMVSDSEGIEFNKTVELDYVGDIPEFVLDNMDKAREQGIRSFMVYSCQSLPVEEKVILQKVDPVMIGWLDDNKTGVVIGIWDRDKEICI